MARGREPAVSSLMLARALLLLVALASSAAAQTVYVNDFEGSDLAGWGTFVSDPV